MNAEYYHAQSKLYRTIVEEVSAYLFAHGFDDASAAVDKEFLEGEDAEI